MGGAAPKVCAEAPKQRPGGAKIGGRRCLCDSERRSALIREATVGDIGDLVRLSELLWPGHDAGVLEEELLCDLRDADAACFLSLRDADPNDPGSGEEAAGFAWCRLRRDYVEGTESSPVGYLEGIFVDERFRGRGHARMLVGACEAWAVSKGCSEFASDCELDNGESLAFHLACGFAEANRIICFAKRLDS